MDKEKPVSLKAEYADIINRLEAMLNAGEISEYIKCTIVDMSGKVLEHIAQQYKNVREGVKSVMVGKVLDYEAKRIKMEGIREGRLEGLREVRQEVLIDLVKENRLSLSEAASKAMLSEEEFIEKMQEYDER